jgi:uncharacterized repeat protein (TIGR02543 family)
MKKFFGILLLLISLFACMALTSCEEEIIPKEITVSCDMDNGSALITKTLTAGEKLEIFTIPEKTHYVFRGLFDGQGTMIVDAEGKGTLALNDSISLTARWEPVVYTVSFDANEGTLASESTISVPYASTLSPLPIPEKEGHDFLGWYNGTKRITNGAEFLEGASVFTTDSYLIENGNVTLTAKYDRKTMNVVFDYNDGSYEQKNLEILYGHKIPENEFPEKDTGDRVLIAWSTAPNTIIEFDGEVTENITLYAIWKNYKVFEFYEQQDVISKSVRVYEGDSLQLYSPEKVGYTFDGWYFSTLYNGVPIASLDYSAPNTKLYAKFDVNSYSITYTLNGGVLSGDVPDSYTVNDKISIPKPLYPVYPLYNNFLGWYEDAACTKPYKSDINTNPRNLVLYAKWDIATVYDTIEETPTVLEGKVILDWKNETALSSCKLLTLGSGAREIILIGDKEKVFENFGLEIGSIPRGQELTVRLVNFKFSNSSAKTISAKEPIKLAISINFIINGECSINSGLQSATAIDIPASFAVFTGGGTLTVNAASGNNGKTGSPDDVDDCDGGDGGDGAAGGSGINAKTVSFSNVTVNITAGNGGNGGRGGHGNNKNVLFATRRDGGDGGTGGNGGYAIFSSSVKADNSVLNLTGGNGGNGGNGGACGKYFMNGNVGKGGSGGLGRYASSVVIDSVCSEIKLVNGTNGTKGANGT